MNSNIVRDERTHIWSMKKKKWIRGPSLLTHKETDIIYKTYKKTSIVSLNRTTYLITGGDLENPNCFPEQFEHSDVMV